MIHLSKTIIEEKQDLKLENILKLQMLFVALLFWAVALLN